MPSRPGFSHSFGACVIVTSIRHFKLKLILIIFIIETVAKHFANRSGVIYRW